MSRQTQSSYPCRLAVHVQINAQGILEANVDSQHLWTASRQVADPLWVHSWSSCPSVSFRQIRFDDARQWYEVASSRSRSRSPRPSPLVDVVAHSPTTMAVAQHVARLALLLGNTPELALTPETIVRQLAPRPDRPGRDGVAWQLSASQSPPLPTPPPPLPPPTREFGPADAMSVRWGHTLAIINNDNHDNNPLLGGKKAMKWALCLCERMGCPKSRHAGKGCRKRS